MPINSSSAQGGSMPPALRLIDTWLAQQFDMAAILDPLGSRDLAKRSGHFGH
ncbi:MAG: hypothetical protein IPP82_03885 [Xanthomonadales bacterium]|nr:hypothetical protein [Xanthomonadales bacterium]